MARASLILRAPEGSGRSYLLRKLQARLAGRRLCYHFSLRAMTRWSRLAQAWSAGFRQAAAGHANVDYQLRRFYQEQDPTKIDSAEHFFTWIKALQSLLINIGVDFLFIFDDSEDWDLDQDYFRFRAQFFHFCQGANLQVIFCESPNPRSEADEALVFSLAPLKAQEIWSELSPLREAIFIYSAGHLALIKRLESLSQETAEDRLAPLVDQLMADLHPQFRLLSNRFTPLQWRLLVALSPDEGVSQPHAWAFLQAQKLGPASSVERALEALRKSERVRQDPDQAYRVYPLSFRRWLQWLYPA